MTPKWEKRFLELAHAVGEWSKQEKKVGAITVDENRHVVGVGYNGPPPEYDDNLLTEENSTDIVIHAEVNALKNSAIIGNNLTIFVTLHPCAKCAKILANSGRIKKIICPPPITTGRWAQSQLEAIIILKSEGIKINYVR